MARPERLDTDMAPASTPPQNRRDTMNEQPTRRDFLRHGAVLTGAAAAGSLWPAGFARAEKPAGGSPNEKLNIACIGIGGRGGAHVGPALDENLVAICDVTDGRLQGCLGSIDKTYREHEINRPLPKTFFDYRELMDKMGDQIDAVVVATPDNHHAMASMRAIKRGKHVYCEKPLTHDLYEARRLAGAARLHNVATQLGNQGRAGDGWRLLCEYLWSGQLGNVQEVHTWTDRPGIAARFWWPQGGTRPPGADPIPSDLHWDIWLGPARERPYLDAYKEGKFKGQRVYQPFVWRGWWDFGTGALGDIGCHSWSGMFTALKVKHATAVTLIEDTGDNTEEMFPSASKIQWDLPARGDMPPCKMFWYDGGKYPPRDLGEWPEGKEPPDNGTLIVTDKGKFWADGEPRPIGKFDGELKRPEPTIPRCESDHFKEWVTAAKGGRPAASNFDHAGPLTELVLLGNLAIKAGVGNKVEWDGPNLCVTNLPALNQHVEREYRAGWAL
ncbi:MAG: oxidoreductase [Armatimonadetes bacterium CG_4_10_14_3_um_filter_66_18]|nr:MAG: oxidoreductase [Armatimonadetes bacterium CG_4_10_14_3_um_filter_66_18]